MRGSKRFLGASLLMFLCFCLPSLSMAAGFRPVQNYETATNPSSVAIADFNGDGKLDLAVTNASGSVSILVGNGDGTFQPARTFATQASPLSAVAADFNGDHREDLALITGSGVGVLLGNGDGTFGSITNVTTAANPIFLAVADFNGDARSDLAVACFTAGVVSVLLGNGDGTFQAHVDYSTGRNAAALALGDLNNDGSLDLIASHDGGLAVLLGNGDGTFRSALQKSLGTITLRPFTADFNGDGNLDLVTGFISVGSTRAGSRIAVLLGLGDGTFGAVHTFGSGSAIATDDFDGDGKPDLVAVNAGNVNLLLGNGDGTFQAPVSFTAGTNPSFAAVADLDGDKAPDLVVANSGDNRVSVFLNTGIDFSISASPLSPPTLSPGQSATSTVTLSLLNAFDNPVALACSVQPSGSGAPTCAMNPSSVSFDSNGKATATLTVNTGAAVTLVAPSFLRRQRLYPFHFVWLPIAGIAVWGTGFGSRRYRRRLVLTIGVSVLLAGLLLQAGCGGDNGSQNGASQTFNIAVNATSGTTAHSATVNLTVK